MGARTDQRVAQLLSRIQGGGILPLGEAARLFGVSEMTVRRDVAASASRLAVLGGHVLAVAEAEGETPYHLDREQDSHPAAKIAACRHALPLIERDDTIFIDSGTTTCHIASRLPTDLNLTVVCFSLNVASILSRMPAIRWMLTGGHFQSGTASFSGPHGPDMLRDIRINKAFVSAGGVHARLGVSCANFSEVAMKQAVLRNAAASYLVVDDSKLGMVRAAFFADCAAFSAIFSERGRIDV